MKDFFISYNKADAEMAIWINWQLKSVGYTTIIQAEDFGPGDNFVLAMQKAATEAARTIAVLSPDYLQAKFTAPEWAAAFAQDPMGEQRLLIPVRVRPVELTGLLKAIVYIDLVDKDEEEAKVSLLSNIQRVAGTPQ
ncbi:MAG: toll/interleukin-1 receptor domain-containing protein, partial [Nitrosomonas sp.]|nr:toll/interleukin-1 receptor domain-containing protein [Nitrosomonas sp.]